MIDSIIANEIESRVTNALKQLIDVDNVLLEHNLNECSINHRLACYLEKEFPGWHVDCEYNKDAGKGKKLKLPKDSVNWDDTEAKSVFPDIIIHRRGGKGPNLLVIEIKKTSNTSDRTHDYNKLRKYVKDLNYKCALFLEIGVKEKTGKWKMDWERKEDFISRS
jgi:hypothetical protein